MARAHMEDFGDRDFLPFSPSFTDMGPPPVNSAIFPMISAERRLLAFAKKPAFFS